MSLHTCVTSSRKALLVVHSCPYMSLHTCVTSRYHQAVFRQYDDSSFSKRTPQPSYMGLIGPLITLETGDVLEVVLKVRTACCKHRRNLRNGCFMRGSSYARCKFNLTFLPCVHPYVHTAHLSCSPPSLTWSIPSLPFTTATEHSRIPHQF
jgi:hypothetical protein